MDQSNVRLIEEMAKLVASQLTSDGGITLPSVGTLSFTTFSTEPKGKRAKKSKSESIQTIILSPESDEYASLTTIIAERGGCSEEQATTLYNRWLDSVRDEEGLIIDGVGAIVNNEFAVDESLFKLLNPKVSIEKQLTKAMNEKIEQIEEEIEATPTKSRSRAPIYWGLAALALIVTLFVNFISDINQDPKAVEVTLEPIAESSVEIEIAPEVEPEPIVTPPTPERELITKLRSKARFATAQESLEAFDRSFVETIDGAGSKRYRVVCGVLNSRVNAGRLLMDAEYRTAGNALFTPRIYPRGEGYMVTLYEGDSFRSCAEFIGQQASTLYDSCWVYNDAKMRL